MGISGLLPLLKDIQVNGHVSDFKGKTLAVDAYVWLHKGAFGCAEDLVKGRKTTRFVDYAMHRVRLLRYHGVTPYVVFDGGPLPAKKGTEVSRAKSRTENLERARSFEAQGRFREARDVYTRCVDITPEMAFQLIKALRAENVDYVVAPYEADAQLCFLEREGFVDGIITEDSDLLVFGCRQVIYKLDGDGNCMHIHRDKLASIREFPMHGWTDLQFRRMAMLSGCDYLDSIPGIGLKTAHRLLRRFHTVEKLLQHVRLEGSLQIPPTYLADFAQAELAFIHQRVFHPLQGRLVPLNDFPEGGLQENDEKWIGLDLAEPIAKGLARGDIHPETQEPIVDEWPDFKPVGRAKPLMTSSRVNVNTPVSAGPMDAFITKMKRPRSIPLPKPVGTFTSGPSRLSDHALLGRTGDMVANDDHQGPLKKSKFFSGPSKKSRQTKPEKVELEWADSDEEPAAGPSRSRSPSVRSPSPAISSIRAEDSPAKSMFGDAHVLTSPHGPMVSSPPCSSPQSCSPEPNRRRSDTRSASPPSPTLASVGSSVLIANSSQGVDAIHSRLSSQVARTPVQRIRHISRIANILIPGSSPVNASFAPATSSDPIQEGEPSTFKRTGRMGHTSSSDTIDEAEVVTPSLDALGATSRKRKRGSVKQERLEEVDDKENERAERAKIVAQGWRLKYSLGSQNSSSPLSDVGDRSVKRSHSDPTPKETPAARKPLKRSITSQAPRPLPLASRSINVPPPVKTTPKPMPKVEQTLVIVNSEVDDIISPSPSPEPERDFSRSPTQVHEVVVPETQTQSLATRQLGSSSSFGETGSLAGSTWSKLEKYRYATKIEIGQ